MMPNLADGYAVEEMAGINRGHTDMEIYGMYM